MRKFFLSLTFALPFLSAGMANSQTTLAAASEKPAVETVQSGAIQGWNGNLGSEPAGVGDLVLVSVAGSPEMSRSYRVSADGKISLPLLPEGVAVSGKNPPEIADAVAKALIEKRLLIRPIVSAEVLEYRSRLVSVVGAVKLPTTLQALGDMKLLDAIARAQGLAPEAGPEIVVTRPKTAETGAENIRISVKALFGGGDQSLNLSLHGGEEIRVPEAPKLYVVGNVRMPGAYPMNELGGTSVMKALAYSQGTQSFTAKEAFVYRLIPGSAERREIVIPLRRILHRESADVPLQASDILYIPENSKMRLSASVLDRLSGVGGSAVNSLIIYH